MIDQVLTSGRVMIGDGVADGLAVALGQGRIVGVGPDKDFPAAAPRYDLQGGLLLPGFIDTQVNGGGGVLFNDNPSVETIRAIGAAHRKFGTTGFLPTLISDDLDKVAAALEATRAAMAAGAPGVLGAHIEGPFLNVERRGIHDAGKLRPLDETGLALLTQPGAGRILVTLAPEMTREGDIGRLTAAGVIVAAGHTNADYARTRDALAEGVTGFTHLFNAMSPLTSRAPGVVGAALSDQSAWCGIIVDGRHVDPAVLKIALACRPQSRFMLVTDAMPCVGATENTFILQGKTITARDGACYDEHGTLAGASLDMASAVRNAVRWLNLDLAAASRMASQNPAEFLGLGHELGRIAPGYRADLVLLDDDLRVVETWIDGLTG